MVVGLVEVVAGMILLFGAGHYLVRGATALALLFRMSPAVIGLTIVAMGTSMPELAVSIDAAARGSTDISYANVIGSNIFNVGAILGIAALTRPIAVQQQTVKLEYPFMVLVAGLVLLVGRDGSVDHLEGVFFLLSLAFFLAYVVYLTRREVRNDAAVALEREVKRAARFEKRLGKAIWINIAIVAAGIGGLVLGADFVIRGAVSLARTLGVEERVIGLTIVAMGTSLPELATSCIAAMRDEQELALGNVVGSNIFNMLAILGTTAAIFPVPVHPRAAAVDNWVMLAFCVALFPMMAFARKVGRVDGVILLAGFVAYMSWLVITA